MLDYQQTPDKISTYNSMDAIIFRINDLWSKFNSYVLSGRLIQANWVLDRLWGELVTDSKPDEQTKNIEFREKLLKIKGVKEMGKLYLFLLEKEEFLRRLQDRQGKGVKHQESALDYMDG